MLTVDSTRSSTTSVSPARSYPKLVTRPRAVWSCGAQTSTAHCSTPYIAALFQQVLKASHTRPLPSRVLVEVAGALTIHFYRLLAHARPLSEKPRVSVRASPLRLHRSGSYMLVEPSLFSTVTRTTCADVKAYLPEIPRH